MQRTNAMIWPVLTFTMIVAGAGGYALHGGTSPSSAPCLSRTSMPMLLNGPGRTPDAGEEAMRAGANWSRWHPLTDF